MVCLWKIFGNIIFKYFWAKKLFCPRAHRCSDFYKVHPDSLKTNCLDSEGLTDVSRKFDLKSTS